MIILIKNFLTEKMLVLGTLAIQRVTIGKSVEIQLIKL